MLERSPETIATVALEVFERMAFLFGERAPVAEVVPPAQALSGTIAFRGADAGTFEVLASSDLGHVLAENVLGCEHGQCGLDSDVDALGELMNVTLGHLLTTLASPAAVFDVAAPRIERDVPRERWQTLAAEPGTLAFLVEGQPLLLRL